MEITRKDGNGHGWLDRARADRVAAYVGANLGRTIRLDGMADAAAMSPYHFARAFKQAMGVTPGRYVMARRICKAEGLLRDTGMPVTEIAMVCGFASHSHFTTAFRSAVGMSPREFRRRA